MNKYKGVFKEQVGMCECVAFVGVVVFIGIFTILIVRWIAGASLGLWL